MYRSIFAGALALAVAFVLRSPASAQQFFPGNGAPPQNPGAQPPPRPAAERGDVADGPGEALTRGPLHEGFAQPVPFNAQPGPIVPRQPPAPVEELPPDQKPAGDNVGWIPGYWSWDDERKDFIWISGVYRALPPNRQWVPGYWNKVATGYQWVPGFWNAAQAQPEYFPQPPESLEIGPSSEASGVDQFWVPGCWMWRDTRYAWRPGFWTGAQYGWTWTPAHYAWTPRGSAFVSGYWDYPCEQRGSLFAPMYFDPGVLAQPNFAYRPSLLIDVAALASNLFCRPAYQQYCFGDYYAPRYYEAGIVPWFSYHGGRRGYCPIYAYQSWRHAHDRDTRWAGDLRRDYEFRRDHVEARPARTFAAQQTLVRNFQQNNLVAGRNVNVNQLALARPLGQVAGSREGAARFERVDRQRQEQLRDQGREVRRFGEERSRLETAGGANVPNRNTGPTRLDLRSPLASRVPATTGDLRQHEANRPRDGQGPSGGSLGNGNFLREGLRRDDSTPRSLGGFGRDVDPRAGGSPGATSGSPRSVPGQFGTPGSGFANPRGAGVEAVPQHRATERSPNVLGNLGSGAPRLDRSPTPQAQPFHAQPQQQPRAPSPRSFAPSGNANPPTHAAPRARAESAPPRSQTTPTAPRNSPTPRVKTNAPASAATSHSSSRPVSVGHNPAPRRAAASAPAHQGAARSQSKPAPARSSGAAHKNDDNRSRHK